MEKIILVQPQNGLNETKYVPLGLISLAAYIRGKFDVKIVDLRFDSEKSLLEAIEKEKPMAVGFSMLTGSCILQIVKLAEEIKNRSGGRIKIFAGGIHPTFFPEQTLKNSFIDFVIVNEGEKVVLGLLEALKGGVSFVGIKGLGWKDQNGKIIVNEIEREFIDMNSLPLPAWDLIDVEKYVKALSRNPGERVIDFYTSKGCPFPCSFCYNLNFNRRRWRCRSAERSFEELKMLHGRYGVNYFIIHDDNFVVDRERALKFARLIIESGIKVKYSIDCRIDFFEKDFLSKLKESGMCELRVGCESGSNRVLKDVIKKGITAEQTFKAVQIAKEVGVNLILSFVIGWPTETIDERQETIDLIIRIQKIHPGAAIYPLWVYIPYPGTSLFDQAIALGFKAPQSLVEWGNYFWGKAHIPWLKNPKEYEMIHELSPFAWYSKKISALKNKSPKNLIRHILIKIFRPFVLFRFEHNFWLFPFEVKAIAALKKIYQRSIKSYDKFLAGNFNDREK
ncbi:MAG: radical SAM protein [Candidatus Portnoybacteria bacterium]|nr:radical SAM protein [Candidatus Portnoybacteria bacterium]